MGYRILVVALAMLVGLSSAFPTERNASSLQNTTEYCKPRRVVVENLPRDLSSLAKRVLTPSDEDCTNDGQVRPAAVQSCENTWECVEASKYTTFPRFVYSVQPAGGPHFDGCKCKPLLYYPTLLHLVGRRHWRLESKIDTSIVIGFVCNVTTPECHRYSC
eukprot:scpid104581/ scgid19324/ 